MKSSHTKLFLILAALLSMPSGCTRLTMRGALPEIDKTDLAPSCRVIGKKEALPAGDANSIEAWAVARGIDYRKCAEAERRKSELLDTIYKDK